MSGTFANKVASSKNTKKTQPNSNCHQQAISIFVCLFTLVRSSPFFIPTISKFVPLFKQFGLAYLLLMVAHYIIALVRENFAVIAKPSSTFNQLKAYFDIVVLLVLNII